MKPRGGQPGMKSLGPGIRRDPEQMPSELAYERAWHASRDYPHRLILDPMSPYEFRYRRSRREALGSFVYRRQLFCWAATERELVGAIDLWQIDRRLWIDNEEFFAAMDECSMDTATLGELLVTSWPEGVDEVFDVGPVIQFFLAWVAPQHSGRVPWAAAATTLIEREFADYSVLLMKAFPLEYGGEAKGHTRRLAHRQAAMRRYYQRLFGVAPMPGDWGRDGWLWRRHPRLTRAVLRPKAVRFRAQRSTPQ
jgi:hypothetical protein